MTEAHDECVVRRNAVWRGGLERLRGLEGQNHSSGLPKLDTWGSKMEVWASKMGSGASKIAPKWLQNRSKLVKNRSKWRFGGPEAPQEDPRGPGRPLGSAPGGPRTAKLGANGPQDLPKWSQNGAKMVPKLGQKRHRIRSSENRRILIDF